MSKKTILNATGTFTPNLFLYNLFELRMTKTQPLHLAKPLGLDGMVFQLKVVWPFTPGVNGAPNEPPAVTVDDEYDSGWIISPSGLGPNAPNKLYLDNGGRVYAYAAGGTGETL